MSSSQKKDNYFLVDLFADLFYKITINSTLEYQRHEL